MLLSGLKMVKFNVGLSYKVYLNINLFLYCNVNAFSWIISEIQFTFSHGTGFKDAKDFAKQPRLELAGKHENFAMFVSRHQSSIAGRIG